MPPKRTNSITTTPRATPNATPANNSQAKTKKALVAWDKDGKDGNTSILILLDWLAVDGNYERWRGDTKTGSTKSALANQNAYFSCKVPSGWFGGWRACVNYLASAGRWGGGRLDEGDER
ncbi:hypothetical protein PTTG_05663 [Puccinia triticina 1-1 BBBD Race 1]|uniref:Uncharacterized protein n=1 Tax=Puccinia triticina (isolate 1-1 / race 1 (BBBD)) TaxID=630390 RepID=A0A180GD65_PUCT1|nr:hypothetical protein PTTG_05663 [Puccinia triticina 1-1 BBBD Race 1]